MKAVPAGEERQNAIADAIVKNAGEKLERMPAKQVSVYAPTKLVGATCDVNTHTRYVSRLLTGD